MKITRHTAKDMRQALRLVRDQLGPDAVILTSKRTPFGVEVTAAVDFDAARVEAQASSPVHSASGQSGSGQSASTLLAQGPSSSEPRTFRPEEFAPPPAAPARPSQPEYDPYTIADVHQNSHARDAHARAEEDVQQSVFARIQAEVRNATAERVRNSEVKAVQSPAPARAVQSAAVSRSGNFAAHLGRNVDERVDIRSAGRAIAAGESVGDDVHAALESAIDSYMAADDVSGRDAQSSASAATLEEHDLDSDIDSRPDRPGDADADRENDGESALGAELKAMRRILETQMAHLAWNDLTRRAPIHTEILRELTEVGITQEFAAQIVAQLPAGTDLIKARRLSISLMATRINVTGDRWLDKGGRVALVGPTGVGKTTALAKLAVRWVLRHGARSVALISADGVRIGAHDQLQALGQMLDVPVYIAESLTEIPKLLEQLAQHRFVLIDTPGMSQRDTQLSERMKQLANSGHGIETALVLSASTQAGAIAEIVARFAAAKAASALLTKVDEAASLGGILSVLARVELPISYVSEGQRVPEDLRPARSLELVSSAVQLARTSGAAADEDLLRRRYGEVAHALA